MKAAAVFADVFGSFSRFNPAGLALEAGWALAVVLAPSLMCSPALADTNDQSVFESALETGLATPVETNTGRRLEVSGAAVPRLDSQDGPFSMRRVDFTSWPKGERASMLGMSLGLSVPPGSPLDPRSTQSLDVGLRWRSTLDSTRRIDVSAWRRVTPEPDAITLINSSSRAGLYGTRVEMQFTASRSRGLVPELGAIGLQLDGGARLSLRAKHGKPMIYYRAKF